MRMRRWHSAPGSRWYTRIAACVLAATWLACATSASRTNELSPGMTKAQVVEILGEPDRTDAAEGEERLYYWLSESRTLEAAFGGLMRGLNIGKGHYLVTLRDGHVVSYRKVPRGE